jgi:serine/threonine-protein kinase
MNLNLQANPQVLLSVYSPSGNKILLEDSSSRALSTTLPEKGFYEFVVVSTASEPIDYQLNITAATTPAPIVERSPSETTTPSP